MNLHLVKKILSLILVVLFIQSISLSQNRVHVGLQTKQQDTGDIFSFPINISTSQFKIASYQFKVIFDPTAIEFLTDNPAVGWSSYNHKVTPGEINFGAFNTDWQSNNFIANTLQFEAIGLAGQVTSVKIIIDFIADHNDDILNFSFTNGWVNLNCDDSILVGGMDSQTSLSQGKYRAIEELNSNALVNTPSNHVIFEAGNFVQLLADFEVLGNSTFYARIRECE